MELRAVAWDESNNYSDIVYQFATSLKEAEQKARKQLKKGWVISTGCTEFPVEEVEIMNDDLDVLAVIRRKDL